MHNQSQLSTCDTNTPQTPLLDMLQSAQGRLRMHMPGHKGVAPYRFDAFAWDMTELACTDDLFAPERGILQAEALAARSAGSGGTLMLTGGGTAGILTMILTAVPPGGTLIVPRDCHHSVLSACVLGDVQPIFVWPQTQDGWSTMDAGDVERAIADHPTADAILLTRPDYRGVCIDLARIAKAARFRNMRVLVDEAHGAHFNWRIEGQPEGAGALGADAWVQSAHKTLPALTGAAWLHLRSADQVPRARAVLRMVHTSSPSFPILASLDATRAWMDANGAQALRALHAQIDDFWRSLQDAGATMRCAHTALRHLPYLCVDPARVVIDACDHGYTGAEVAAWLSERGIDVEMADTHHAVLIPTVCDPPGALTRVYDALLAIPRKPALDRSAQEPVHALVTPPPSCMRVRPAALAKDAWVPLAQAEGRIAAQCAGMYPPGIPIIAPGERVTAEVIAALTGAKQRFGVEMDRLRCVQNG